MRLQQDRKLLVGVNWQGTRERNSVQPQRAYKLQELSPLIELEDIVLISLQKGEGVEQLADCSFSHRFTEHQGEITEIMSFTEMCAIISACDVIITNDTVIAHIAGALGMKTYTLLKKSAEWRWGLEGDNTIWYKDMTLIRQKSQGDWNGAVIELKDRLIQLITERKRSSES